MLNTFPGSGFDVPAPSGITNIYNTTKTLASDLIAGDLILTDTIINTAGYRIYCKSLTMNGSTIQNNGGNASGATGGTGAPFATAGGGGNGGTSAISQVPPDNFYYAALGGSGGRGMDGSAVTGLAGGVTAFQYVSQFPALGTAYSNTLFEHGYVMGVASTHAVSPYLVWGGAGGGQGGAPTTSLTHGGGGGGGGGVVLICCSGNVSLKSSLIRAVGGSGGNASVEAGYTGGGGGGGGGGAIIIRCSSLFIKGLTGYGLTVSGGGPGSEPSPSGAGNNGSIIVNTATNTFLYPTSSNIGGTNDVILS